RLAQIRLAFRTQGLGKCRAQLYKAELLVLPLELVQRDVYGLPETVILDACNLARQCVRLWILDVEGHWLFSFVYPDIVEGIHCGNMQNRPTSDGSQARERLIGIALVILSACCFGGVDAISKLLADTNSVGQIVWARYTLALPVLIVATGPS